MMLGKDLRARRLNLDLSQYSLGLHFGVTRMTVYRWERGVERVPVWMPYALTGLEKELSP